MKSSSHIGIKMVSNCRFANSLTSKYCYLLKIFKHNHWEFFLPMLLSVCGCKIHLCPNRPLGSLINDLLIWNVIITFTADMKVFRQLFLVCVWCMGQRIFFFFVFFNLPHVNKWLGQFSPCITLMQSVNDPVLSELVWIHHTLYGMCFLSHKHGRQ